MTSCYLDVDGRRLPRQRDIEQSLEQLLRSVGSQADTAPSVCADLTRIRDYVRRGFERSRTRGLAMFSCSERELFRVLALPMSVRNQIVINELPAVGQLESLVQSHERLGVLLVDRRRARMFLFHLGELVDRSELFDELPRDYDVRGQSERGDIANHVEELAAQHARRAAQVAFHVHKHRGFDRLTLGGPEEIVGQVEAALHPYLRDKLCERIEVTVAGPLEEIHRAATELSERAERRKEADAVEALRAAVATRRGVAGLESTLRALSERRVGSLLVSSGYSAPGWRCPCGSLAVKGPTCAGCDADMRPSNDIVEDAVEATLGSGGRVEVCVENADLDVLGRIGALLRF